MAQKPGIVQRTLRLTVCLGALFFSVNAFAVPLTELLFESGSGNTAFDSSGSGNNGAVIGGALFAAETPNNSIYSLELDGANDSIDLGPLDPDGNALTLAAWIKADAFPGRARDPRIISKASGNAANKHVFELSTVAAGSTTRLRFRLRINGSTKTLRANPGTGLTTGQWYHTAATYDGNVARLYLDGIEVGMSVMGGPFDRDSSINISVGSHPQGGSYFNGLIDDVKIYQRALDSTEIDQLINAVGDLPTATADNYTVDEDTTLTIAPVDGVLANDIDSTEPLDLRAELNLGAQFGEILLSESGAFTYTPNDNFTGSDSFTYRVIDSTTGTSAIGEALLSVSPVNDAPVAVDDSVVTATDSVATGNVLSNDLDIDTQVLQANLVQPPQFGTLELLPGGNFTYAPQNLFIGIDTFTYRATDGSTVSNLATVQIEITDVIEVDDGLVVHLALDDGANPASDLSGLGNSGEIIGPVYVGESADASTGSLRFDGAGDTVDLGFLDANGSGLTLAAWIKADSFPGRAKDPRIISKASGYAANSHIFMLSTVAAGSETRLRFRVRVGGATQTLRADAGSGLSTDQWYHTAATYDGSTVTLYLDGQPVGSSPLTGPVDIDPGMRVAVGSHPGGGSSFNGLIDNARIYQRALSAAEIAGLMTTAAGPLAAEDSYNAIEDTVFTANALSGVLANDTDPEGGALTAAIVTPPANGSLDLSTDGSFTYTPDTDFFGPDSFTYRAVSSATNAGSVAVVSLLVDGAPDAPVATDDSYNVTAGQVLTGNVLTNDTDSDGDSLTVSLIEPPQTGAFDLQSDGSFVYTAPETSNEGIVSFVYQASDGALNSAQTTATINVSNSPEPGGDLLVDMMFDDGLTPATDSSGQGNFGLVTGAVYSNQSADGSASSMQFSGANDRVDIGNFDVNGNGLTLSAWIKANSFPGNARDPRIISKASSNAANDHVFMLSTIAKSGGKTGLRMRVRVNGRTFTLKAIGSNNNLDLNRWYHVAGTFDESVMRLYVDGVEISTLPVSGKVDVDPAVGVSIGSQPGGGQSFDGLIDAVKIYQRALSPAELLGLSAADGTPVANDDGYTVTVNSVLNVGPPGILTNDSDPDQDPVFAQLVNTTTNGQTVLAADGSFQYTPNPDFTGTDSFSYLASDGVDESQPAVVQLFVQNLPNQAPRFQTGEVIFTKLTIDNEVDGAHYAGGADIDNDGRTDIVGTDYIDGIVFLYRQNPDGTFTREALDDQLAGAYPGFMGDVDDDQDIDILAGGYLADTLAWYVNDGLGGFTKQVVDSDANGIHSMEVVDLDADGDSDILAALQDANSIVWYRNTAGTYEKLVIDANTSKAKRADFADLDGDGDIDVAAASDGVNRIAWYENDGNENFTRRIVDGNLETAYFVYTVDINNDTFIDLLAAGKKSNTVAIYRNNGLGSFTKQVIDTNARGARTVYAADLDGDTDLDIIGNSVQNDAVYWYENTGFNTYTKHVIDVAAPAAYGVVATDVDGDGDPEILMAGRDDNSINIYYNSRTHTLSVTQNTATDITASVLLVTDQDDATSSIVFTIMSAPIRGDLRLAGATLATGDTFTQSDVDNGLLSYQHLGVGTVSDTFELSVTDGLESGHTPALSEFILLIE